MRLDEEVLHLRRHVDALEQENRDLRRRFAFLAQDLELARAKVLEGDCWVHPVLANGKIYCRSHQGDLVCLDVKGK